MGTDFVGLDASIDHGAKSMPTKDEPDPEPDHFIYATLSGGASCWDPGDDPKVGSEELGSGQMESISCDSPGGNQSPTSPTTPPTLDGRACM